MRSIIRQALNKLKEDFGENAFINTNSFRNKLDDVKLEADDKEAKIIRRILRVAICDMQAYSRLKTVLTDNLFIIDNLASEMSTDYMINDKNATKMVIECVAELLGYQPSFETSYEAEKDLNINLQINQLISSPDYKFTDKAIQEEISDQNTYISHFRKMLISLPNDLTEAQNEDGRLVRYISSMKQQFDEWVGWGITPGIEREKFMDILTKMSVESSEREQLYFAFNTICKGVHDSEKTRIDTCTRILDIEENIKKCEEAKRNCELELNVLINEILPLKPEERKKRYNYKDKCWRK